MGGREYRIYSKGVGWGGDKGDKSCPEYDKVRIGEIFEKNCQIKGRICHLCHLSAITTQILVVSIALLHFQLKTMHPLTIYCFSSNLHFVVAELLLQDDMVTNQITEGILVEVSLL